MDGAFGWVPYYTLYREHAIPFLTRLTRPELFQQADVLQALREGPWHPVPDSRTGPLRGAMELGRVTVAAAPSTVRPDGRPYEPITVRVVVSRYPRQQKAEHGVVIEGWQYELFAVDVPIEAFSAADAIASYFGRSGQENRFAQEDREAGLDRLFSYHLPGQALASLVGFLVWNLRVVRGFQMEPPPQQRPVQAMRTAPVDDRSAQVPSPQPPVCPPADEPPPVSPLVQRLGELSWSDWLTRHRRWRFQAQDGTLSCPDRRALKLTTVSLYPNEPRNPVLIFRRPSAGCEQCPVRTACLPTQRVGAVKHVKVSVPREAARLHAQLSSERAAALLAGQGVAVPHKPRRARPRRPPSGLRRTWGGQSPGLSTARCSCRPRRERCGESPRHRCRFV
jgi:hypothetical protein